MDAFHLKTIQQVKYQQRPSGPFVIDSIYIPSNGLYVGVYQQMGQRAIIVRHTSNDDAKTIVDGKPNNVYGRVVLPVNLDKKDLHSIANNPDGLVLSLARPFNHSTDGLMDILTGQNLTFGSAIRRFATIHGQPILRYIASHKS